MTGVDRDRLAEEKARGITIDLGFTHLEEASASGVIEVGASSTPGHEKFLHQRARRPGGIRLVMLIAAADEGVMPADLGEHLAIAGCSASRRRSVLTKVDLVGEEERLLARLELGELLAPTPYAEAPILEVSSVSGVGVESCAPCCCSASR